MKTFNRILDNAFDAIEALAVMAIGAVALLVGFSVAHAASLKDIDDRDRPMITAPRLDPNDAPFTGLGVGVDIGAAFAAIAIEDEFDGISADGITYGGHLEWLFGYGNSSLRFGPYAQIGGSTVNTELGDDDALTLDFYYGAGAKAGVVFNQTLLSVHLGVEWQRWGSDLADIEIDSSWLNAGVGIEFAVQKNVSVGLEASYLSLLDAEGDHGIGDIGDELDESEQLRVQFRVTFRQ
jgi:opacity protein-like surface antigen